MYFILLTVLLLIGTVLCLLRLSLPNPPIRLLQNLFTVLLSGFISTGVVWVFTLAIEGTRREPAQPMWFTIVPVLCYAVAAVSSTVKENLNRLPVLILVVMGILVLLTIL